MSPPFGNRYTSAALGFPAAMFEGGAAATIAATRVALVRAGLNPLTVANIVYISY